MQFPAEVSLIHMRPCRRALHSECYGHNHQFLFWTISQMLITVLLAVHVNSLPRCLLCSFGFILVHEGSLQSTGASGQQDAAATPFADASVLLLAPVLCAHTSA